MNTNPRQNNAYTVTLKKVTTQAVGRWLVTAECKVHCQASLREIYDGHCCTGRVFSESFDFPCQYNFTEPRYTFTH